MTSQIVDGEFEIKPQDIDASKHFFDAFDHCETEVSAGWLVRFAQQRGQGWAPFTFDEINAFYGASSPPGVSSSTAWSTRSSCRRAWRGPSRATSTRSSRSAAAGSSGTRTRFTSPPSSSSAASRRAGGVVEGGSRRPPR